MADAVGVLLRWSDGTLAVQRRDGTVVEIDQDTLVAGKRVPPRPAIARTHSEVGVRDLQEVAAAGWPAPETEQLGDWTLRAGQGWTMRANSVLALGDPGLDRAAALAHVQDWYAQRGLPARFSVAPALVPELEADLAARGWPMHREFGEVQVLTTDTAAIWAEPVDAAVELTEAPGAPWWDAYRMSGPVPEVAAAILIGPAETVFAQVRDGTEIVAIGRAVVERGWVGISTVETAPAARRRGLASAVVRRLVGFGRARGARHVYLQVGADNAPALALYDRLDLRVHHIYRYRVAP